MYCWANVLSKGGIHDRHTHQDSVLSAVYYLDLPEYSGKLRFHDTRGLAAAFPELIKAQPPFDRTYEILPNPGKQIFRKNYVFLFYFRRFTNISDMART